MKARYNKILGLTISAALMAVASQSMASDFNLPFVNGADLGTMYSGWAAQATDASTSYTNPAGLALIPNQQLVASGVLLTGTTQFAGTTQPPFPPFPPQSGTASSFISGFMPSFYYAAPLSNNVVFGFGETIPFGLGTNYESDSIVRYAATKTKIGVVDMGPSLGFKINDKLSFGFGLDVDRLSLTLNSVFGIPPYLPDSKIQNEMNAWGYGWHTGLLYQFTPATRMGLSYNSAVNYRPTGSSEIYGPIITGGDYRVNYLRTRATLPSLTQLSIYHDIDSQWTATGTIFYTNWAKFQRVTLHNLAIPGNTTTTVTMPFNFHDTFDYAGGLSYKANDKWKFSTGLELLQTPSNNRNRIVNDPVGSGTIASVGAHYQQSHALGYDLGYGHGFFREMAIHHVAATDVENGNINTNSNIMSGQVTWNIG